MKESKSIKTAKHLLVRLTLFMMIFTSAFVYSRSADAAGLVNRKHKTKVDRQLTLKERREKMDAYNAELKKIMTPEQYEAYEKRMQEMRNRRPQMPRQ